MSTTKLLPTHWTSNQINQAPDQKLAHWILVCTVKANQAESLATKYPKYAAMLHGYDGYTYQDYIDAMVQELDKRTVARRASEIKNLQYQINELKSREEKKAELQDQLDKLLAEDQPA